MSRVLPILFGTEMVRAILDDRKTVTRRIIRYKYNNTEMRMRKDKYGTRLIEIQKEVEGETHGRNSDGSMWHKMRPYIEKNPPYKRGDIMYVRETWAYHENAVGGIIYRARCPKLLAEQKKWHPSIHMPKEATRIWLKIVDVKVERLQNMSLDDFLKEGVVLWPEALNDPENAYQQAKNKFKHIWNSTIKKPDLEMYGWDASPWTWVIEFERCERPDEDKCQR